MDTWIWIAGSSLFICSITLVGAFSFFIKESTFKKITPLFVALAAGTLFGGSLFHMLPRSIHALGNQLSVYICFAAGFTMFLAMEQFLHWHHCHEAPSQHKAPLTYMILIADGLHNFLGGLGIGASFIMSPQVGLTATLAAALHEIPQELGDFGVLVHGGWSRRQALLFNMISSLSFPLGAFLAYNLPSEIPVEYLVPFTAGNFLYISATDLLPEVKRHSKLSMTLAHLFLFIAGMALLLGLHEAIGRGLHSF